MGRVWTIEERQKQAERIRSQKPWLKSTGPRTTRGKVASSQNATRHGGYSAEFRLMCRYLKLQKHYIDTLRIMRKSGLFLDDSAIEISGNELNENVIKSIQNDTNCGVKWGHFQPIFPANQNKKTRPFGRALYFESIMTKPPSVSDKNQPLPIRVADG